MVLAAPPLAQWPFALLSIAPLVHGASRPGAKMWRDGGLMALGAIPHWLVIQWWVHEVTAAGFVPFVLVLAALTGIATTSLVLAAKVRPGRSWVWLTPVCWSGVEYFRGEVFGDGYAWGFPVHPLIDAPGVSGLASVGGVYLVSVLLSSFSGGVVDLMVSRRLPAGRLGAWRRVTGVMGVLSLPLGCVVGAFVAPPSRTGDQVTIGAVQTNLAQNKKAAWTIDEEVSDFERFGELSRQAAGLGAELIAWPETMTPGVTLVPESLGVLDRERIVFPRKDGTLMPATALTDAVLGLQRELGLPMIVGEEALDGLKVSYPGDNKVKISQQARYNSAFMLLRGKVTPDRYDKMRLTPFGETMPGIRDFPSLQRALLDIGAKGMRFDLAMGKTRRVFAVPRKTGVPVRVVTPICFEMSVAPICRELVFERGVRRADVIVTVTNDGWFGESDLARRQHLQLAQWRAAELATPVVRVVNTGISAFIDERGRVQASGVEGQPGAARVDGVLVRPVALVGGATTYAKSGEWAGVGTWVLWMLLLARAAVGTLLGTWRGQRRTRRLGRR